MSLTASTTDNNAQGGGDSSRFHYHNYGAVSSAFGGSGLSSGMFGGVASSSSMCRSLYPGASMGTTSYGSFNRSGGGGVTGSSSFVLYSGRGEVARLSDSLGSEINISNLEISNSKIAKSVINRKDNYGAGDDAKRDMIEKSSCSWEEGNSNSSTVANEDESRKCFVNKSSSSSTGSTDRKFVPYSKLNRATRRWQKKEERRRANRRRSSRMEQRQDRDLARIIPSKLSLSSRTVFDSCLHQKPESCRLGRVIVNSSHLLFSYEEGTLNSSVVDEVDMVDYHHLFPPQQNIVTDDVMNTSSWSPKKRGSVRRWGKHALERHNQRDYDGNYSDGDSSTSTESSTDSSLSCQCNSSVDVDSSLIRTVEEKARRRLQELDYAEKEIADTLNFDTRSSFTHTSQNTASRWEKEHLRKIERRAKRYIRKLDDCSSDSSCSDTSTGSEQPQHDNNFYSNISSFNDDLDDGEHQFYDPQHESAKGFKIPLNYITEMYPRTFQMRDIAVEIFISPQPPSSHPPRLPLSSLSPSSFIIVIPDDQMPRHRGRSRRHSSRRNQFASLLRSLAPNLSMHYWHAALNAIDTKNRPSKYNVTFRKDTLRRLTKAWRNGLVSNFDYLSRINAIAGRTRVDLSHYPIMPWVLSNYSAKTPPDLNDRANFRDLTKPMGALCPQRLEKFLQKYKTLCSYKENNSIITSNSNDSASSNNIPPFMYGSHYSTSGGVVLHYLVRLRPFAGLHRQLQGGIFDVPDRLFDSIPRSYDMCSKTSPTEVKELTPEFYSEPSFLKNKYQFSLGKRQRNGEEIGDVKLPPWADDDPNKFIQIMRDALESDVCSSMLPDWIDLIFGFKQKGHEAEKASNVFYHVTYYNTEDLAKIEDGDLRREAENHIADFGHCPTQLFFRPHPRKKI